jgi:hypothetical protein
MPVKTWSFTRVTAADILSAAKTIGDTDKVQYVDETAMWLPAADYLEWARHGMTMNTPMGNDIAVCYAKRSVCRYIDQQVRVNNLDTFAGRSYPDKIEVLSEVGISVPEIVHELVIDPRNDIEHSYGPADTAQASRAVDLADLLLRATIREASTTRLVSLGWNIGIAWRSDEDAARLGPFKDASFGSDPMLLVDPTTRPPRIMILLPKDDEVLWASTDEFNKEGIVQFAKLMKQRREKTVTGLVYNWSCDLIALDAMLSFLGLKT